MELCALTPEDLLRSYVHSLHRDADALFAFTKQMTTQLGLINLLNYLLSMTDLSPMKFVLSTDTGQLVQLEFKPTYNPSTLSMDFAERVPFRLTRNIETLVGPFGRLGLLPAVMYALVQCLHRNDFHLRNLLCLIIRDDLSSIQSQKQQQLLRASTTAAAAAAAAAAPLSSPNSSVSTSPAGHGTGGGDTASDIPSPMGSSSSSSSSRADGEGDVEGVGGADELQRQKGSGGGDKSSSSTSSNNSNSTAAAAFATAAAAATAVRNATANASAFAREMTEVNVRRVVDAIQRIEGSAAIARTADGRDAIPINRQVMALLNIASRKEILCMMKPTWQAWF